MSSSVFLSVIECMSTCVTTAVKMGAGRCTWLVGLGVGGRVRGTPIASAPLLSLLLLSEVARVRLRRAHSLCATLAPQGGFIWLSEPSAHRGKKRMITCVMCVKRRREGSRVRAIECVVERVVSGKYGVSVSE